MELPYELKKLPPQALDVIRFLSQQGGQADAVEICEGADLSNRAFGKAIRRLVTRNYLTMDMDGYYQLTSEGVKAAKIITKVEESGGLEDDMDEDESVSTTRRRLTIVMPRLLGTESPAQLYANIERPRQSRALRSPASLVLRIEGVNCEISPSQYTFKVPEDDRAEPAAFTVTAEQTGQGRLRLRAYQMVRADEVAEVGGMYCDFLADAQSSPDWQAIGIDLNLHNA